MAKKTTTSQLEVQVHDIISRAGRDIAIAVRADFAGEIQRLIGLGAPVAQRGHDVHLTPVVPHHPAPRVVQTPAERARGKGKGTGRPRSAKNQAAIDALIALIRANPGLRSEEIQMRIDMPHKLLKATLSKLRAANRVKTSGMKRATTYTAA